MSEKINRKKTKFGNGQMYFSGKVDARKVIEENPKRVFICSPSCLSPLSALTMSLMCDRPPEVRAWGSGVDMLSKRTQTAVREVGAESEKLIPALAETLRECADAIVDKLANPNICT